MTVISRLPMPADAAAEQPQLTDSQHSLRRAIAAKSHEERLVAAISERLQRLEQIMHEDRQLGARIRELQITHQGERALWFFIFPVANSSPLVWVNTAGSKV